MKNILVISGHPDLANVSLANKTIIETLKKHQNVTIRDLATLYPDFKIDIQAEQNALVEADAVVLQFPLFWYSVPAALKQWLDSVLTYGFAYGSNGDKLHGKGFAISTTTGSKVEAYGKEGYNNYTVEEFLTPLVQTANLCGMTFEGIFPAYGMNLLVMPGDEPGNEEEKKRSIVERCQKHAEALVAKLS